MNSLCGVIVILCVISYGYSHEYYNRNQNSWGKNPKDYNYFGNYYGDYNSYSNSWNRRSPHNSNNKEKESNDYSGYYDGDYSSSNYDSNDYNYDNGHSKNKECYTPNGEKAKCIPLDNCPILKQYSFHYHYTDRFFKESKCGYTYSDLLVCCGTENKYKKNQEPSTNHPSFLRGTTHFYYPSSRLPSVVTYPSFVTSPSSRLPPPTTTIATSSRLPPTTTTIATSSRLPPTTTTTIATPQEEIITTTVPPVQQDPITEVPNLTTTPPSSSTPSDTRNILVSSPESMLRNHANFNLLPSRDTCGLQGLDDKVFGGSEAGLNEFPWMTLLEFQLNGISTGYKCGGMLINDKYVLTAAHCVSGNILPRGENVMRVRLGEHDITTVSDCRTGENNTLDCNLPPQDLGIEEIIIHPGFNVTNRNMLNDIALLRLNPIPTQNEFVGPICLPTNGERAFPGQNLTISGWGVTEIEAFSTIKIKAPAPYIEDNECKALWKSAREISDNQFCAGDFSGISACSGDSGGAIMALAPGTLNWYAEGIVSYGRLPCGIFPNVFTRVSSYIIWILDNIKP